MEVNVLNCNNIKTANVSIIEGRLNIKYAINGTGKSTLSKAIVAASTGDSNALSSLTPYQYIGDLDPEHAPSVHGLSPNLKTAVFDESYVDQYVFQEDELLKNSFAIFVKTKDYERRLNEINGLISSVRSLFDNNPELEDLINAVSEFISVFGTARSGIAKSSTLVKGMSRGNQIVNIPPELIEYSAFLTNEQNVKWLSWQATGRTFMELDNKCPFCASELAPRREMIERINTEYNAKTIEHLSKILGLFERLGHYFSEDTNRKIRIITQNVEGLSEEQQQYLIAVKHDAETLYSKLQAIKQIGFDSLKDIDRIAVAIPNYKIEMEYLEHLDSKTTREKVATINRSIDELNEKVGLLQGAIQRQKGAIQKTIERYDTKINDFLKNAGYNYTVSIDETADHTYKLLLKVGNEGASVSSVKTHLSFGERNAFALVLFMYQAIYDEANLIILDDPISSFDTNKKFAILDMLFVNGESLRGKTTLLLTHDFEPVIDVVYNHSSYFDGPPVAFFMENISGMLSESAISKADILSSIQVAKENIEQSANPVSKLIYLRRYTEITEGKGITWNLLSNLLHVRKIATLGEGNRPLTEQEISEATEAIQKFIPDFDYMQMYAVLSNRDEMIRLYKAVGSNYEKLQIFRILFDPKDENRVLRKFINESYHVENDYLFQLNPLMFNTIPNYVISECDQAVSELEP